MLGRRPEWDTLYVTKLFQTDGDPIWAYDETENLRWSLPYPSFAAFAEYVSETRRHGHALDARWPIYLRIFNWCGMLQRLDGAFLVDP